MQPPTQLPKGKPSLQTNRNWYKSLQTALPLPMRLSNGKISLETQRLPDGTFIQDRPSDNLDQDTQDITNY